MRLSKWSFIVAVILALPLPAEGAVFERDLFEPGDGLLTYDNVNQREWLDLPETAGVELSTVLEWMAPGGKLEGFSFAMLEDVEALAFSAGVQWSYPWGLPYHGREPVEFIELLGAIVDTPLSLLGYQITYGLIAVDFQDDQPVFDSTSATLLTSDPEQWQPGSLLSEPFYGGAIFISHWSIYSDVPNWEFDGIGPFWLYREAVPEPSSLVLLVMGGAGLWWRRSLPL